MKKGLNSALASLLTSGVLVATVALGITGGRAQAATPPASQPNASAAFSWNNPINVSHGGQFYDNTAQIAASQTTGSVSVGWTRTIKGSTDAFITQASNGAVGTDTFVRQDAFKGDDQQMGNVSLAHDSLGNRHMVWWAISGGAVTGQYAVIDVNGNVSRPEEVPGTRGANRKNVALAIGPDNSVHVLFGRNNSDIYYYHRATSGAWDVVADAVPVISRPVDLAIAVTSRNVVMVGFKDIATQGRNNDIYTTIRLGAFQWAPLDDSSAPCCTGCPFDSHAYQPVLAADPFGGMRLAWSDERCDPSPSDPPTRDIYYREWVPGTGFEGKPLVRVVTNSGDSYYPSMAVDRQGTAHILWSDTTSSPINYFRSFYTYGSGTSFAPVQLPADPYFGRAFQKEPSIDVSPGYVHTEFSSDRDDSQKEVYYQYSPIDDGQVTPPTPTPAAQPPCANERFKDNCQDSPFYQAILALNDQGAFSGYSSAPPCPNQNWVNCFLPNNNITRQQTAKVISLSAHLPANLQGAPHFADVPNDNPFYNFIEYAYNANIIGGYTCGGTDPDTGANEPCDGQNRPYFRPGSNVTRGQLSKMASEAFDFQDVIIGQTFQDVPAGSTFYVFVERLSRHNVISGYTCGGDGEPCQAGNRKYFRPGDDVTRGQAAKIIYGAQQQAPTPTPVPPTSTQLPPTNTAIPPTNTVVPPTNTAVLTSTAVPPTSTATSTATTTSTSTPTATTTSTSTTTSTPTATATVKTMP